MENSRKIDFISLLITFIITVAGLGMALVFFNLTNANYTVIYSEKTDNFKINQNLYDKIITGTERGYDIQPDNNDFGKSNPFETRSGQ